MKTSFLIVAMTLLSLATRAQDNTSTGTPLWEPPKAACDAYNAEKNASENMTPAVKSLYEAGQDKEETRASDILMPIICNPPTITNDNSSSGDPDKKRK